MQLTSTGAVDKCLCCFSGQMLAGEPRLLLASKAWKPVITDRHWNCSSAADIQHWCRPNNWCSGCGTAIWIAQLAAL